MSKYFFSFFCSEIFSENLEEATPEDGDPTGSVEVHQLEDEGPALGDHGNSQCEENQAKTHSELPSDWSEVKTLI